MIRNVTILGREDNLIIICQSKPTDIKSLMMQPTQRNAIPYFIFPIFTMGNNVSSFNFPAQVVR